MQTVSALSAHVEEWCARLDYLIPRRAPGPIRTLGPSIGLASGAIWRMKAQSTWVSNNLRVLASCRVLLIACHAESKAA